MCARAQVVLKPKGANGIELLPKSVKAAVEIVKGRFATTDVDLVFHNDINDRIEADFLYTVPPGAVVTDFAYYAGAERVPARIEEKALARQVYDTITAVQHDPALIEMVGKNTFRTRIFPVEPNADLRVQMRWVQALPAGTNGRPVYTLPIRTLGRTKWDEISVRVRSTGMPGVRLVSNLGLTATHFGSATSLAFAGKSFHTQKDLRISVSLPREAQPVQYFAAPSGGTDGFFAAVLSAPGKSSFDSRSVRFSGVPVYDVETKRYAGKNELLICGRYRQGGTVRMSVRDTATGTTRTTAPLRFSTTSQPNNVASKLWAAARLEHLGQQNTVVNRDTGIALSKRFTLPSCWTSWIAIPEAERKQRRQEIERQRTEARRDALAEQLYKLHRRHQDNGAQAARLRDRYAMLGKQVGDEYPENTLKQSIQGQYWWEARNLAEKVQAADLKYGMDSTAYRESNTRLINLCREGECDPKDALEAVCTDHAREWIPKYVELVRIGAVDSPEAKAVLRRLTVWNRYSSTILGNWLPGEISAESVEAAGEWLLGTTGESVSWRHYAYYEGDLNFHHTVPKLTERQAAELYAEVVRMSKYGETTPANSVRCASEPWLFWLEYRANQEAGGKGTQTYPETDRLKRLRTKYTGDAKRDIKARIERYDQVYFKPIPASAGNPENLERELRTPLSPAETKSLRSWRERVMATEGPLSARLGDPLISIAAPKDARSVIAVLPNGEIVPLAWNETAQCWQARFDIPTYAAAGDYAVTVHVLLANNTRQTKEFRYTVDMTAPHAVATAIRTGDAGIVALSAVADTDTARVSVVGAEGEVVALVADPAQPERFFGRTTKPMADGATVSFIVVDRAHNRTVIDTTVTGKGIAQ